MTKTWVHGLTDGRGTPIGAVPTGEGHRYTLYGLDESGDLGLSMECYIVHVVLGAGSLVLGSAQFVVQFCGDSQGVVMYVSARDFARALRRDDGSGSAAAAMASAPVDRRAARSAARSALSDGPGGPRAADEASYTRGAYRAAFRAWCDVGVEGCDPLSFYASDNARVDERTTSLAPIHEAIAAIRREQLGTIGGMGELRAAVERTVAKVRAHPGSAEGRPSRSAKRMRRAAETSGALAHCALDACESQAGSSAVHFAKTTAAALGAVAQLHDPRLKSRIDAVRAGSADDTIGLAITNLYDAVLNVSTPDADPSRLWSEYSIDAIGINPFAPMNKQTRKIPMCDVERVMVTNVIHDVLRARVEDVAVRVVATNDAQHSPCVQCLCGSRAAVDEFNARVDAGGSPFDRVHAELVDGRVQCGTKRFVSTAADGSRRVEVTMLGGDTIAALRSTVDPMRGGSGESGGSGGGGSAADTMRLLQNLRRAYSPSWRSGKDHAANGSAVYIGQTMHYAPCAKRRRNPSVVGGADYWFLPRLPPARMDFRIATNAEAKLAFDLCLKAARVGAVQALNNAERLQACVEPLSIVLRRKLHGLDAKGASKAAGASLDHTSLKTNGAGIVTDGFSGVAHFDSNDNAMSTLCIASVHAQVQRDDGDGDGRVPIWDARNSIVSGASSRVRMPLPAALGGGRADVAVDVFASMSFVDLYLDGKPLRTALTDACATMWSGKYRKHATNLAYAQSGSHVWALRAPPVATWEASPLSERIVVGAWGGYNSKSSRALRDRARDNLRAALAP